MAAAAEIIFIGPGRGRKAKYYIFPETSSRYYEKKRTKSQR
jgi:hypothetical protein